nr:MAG TPA: hypothetical protein [Caudoviricetes sp.]
MKNLQLMEMMLRMKNPEIYNQYIQYKNSGKKPEEVIDELMKSGRINQDMLNKAKNMAQNGDLPGNNYSGPRF